MAIKFFNNVAVDSDVLYVDAVNNEVGIGTTNPLAKLQVNAGGSDISAQLGLDLFGSFKLGDVIANYAGGGIFYDGTPGSEDVQISTRTFRISGSSGEGIEGASNGDVYLRSQFGVLATIDASNNNFGIGTVDPSTKLEVEGGDGLLQLSTTSSTGSPYMSFAQAGARRSFIQHADSGDYLKLASEYGGISFFTGTGGTETQKMTILSGGNVGIGDTAPDAKLTVFRTDSTYAVNLSDTESRAGLSVKSSSSFDSKLTISSGASSRQYIQAVNNAATTGRDIAINPYGGNVGIGTTSPAQKLDVAGSVRVQDRLYTNANATNTVGILGKATVNGWGARYDSNNANFSGFYFDGSHHSLILGRNAAGTITNYIHASGNSYFNGGNVGIGNTSPTYLLDVNEDDNVLAFRVTGGGGGNPIASFVRDVGSTGASVNIGASSNFPQIQFVSTGNTFSIGADSSGNFKISDNTSIGTNDRITIDNIGRVGIGTTIPGEKLHVVGNIKTSGQVIVGPNTQSGSNQAAASFITENDVTIGGAINWWSEVQNGSFGTYNHAVFYHGATQAGSIRRTGNSTVSYNTSSDYRLKENVIEIADGIERVKQLKPSKFNFIGEERIVDGFLAHEVQNVVPESISGEKDEVNAEGNPVYQAIDQSKIVPLLAAALKEAIEKIEQLETKIQTLENK